MGMVALAMADVTATHEHGCYCMYLGWYCKRRMGLDVAVGGAYYSVSRSDIRAVVV